MAEQIVQTLGFDASGAIATINQLNQSLAQLEASLTGTANAARAFNKAGLSRAFNNIKKNNPAEVFNNATGAAQNMGNAINNAGNQAANALNNANQRTQSLTISWQTLSRIIVAQTIVRGINAITSAIGNSIEQTRELQKRIGEIQTIAQGRLGGNADVLAGLEATAEKFGFDILDVAEAKYQELSNQVEGSTDSIEFQEAAAKLARATNSSLTDSVNLLSSALNAFGKNASQSEEVAGILFTTIEQGRIRASELANTLGRVAPLTNALGVDFTELGGALARITQGGTRADTALTQFLGILNKLSKPTGALKEAFDQLGVSTAQEGITQSGGLLPFLERLQKVAGDNGELVTFFNNVRAIQGVLALLGTDAEKTAEVFDAFSGNLDEFGDKLNEAFQTATANDAVTYEKLVQQLNSQFRELATEVIPLINGALEFFLDTLNKIRDNPILTGVLLGSAAGALIGVGAAATIASGGMAAFAGSVGAALIALGPAVLIFGAVALAATAMAKAINDAEIAGYAPLIERAKARLEELNKAIEDSETSLKEQAQSFKDSGRAAVEFGKQFENLRKQARDSISDLNREFVASSEAALDSVLKSRQAISKEIQKAISDADSQLQKSQDKITDISAKKDDFLLQRRLKNLNEIQQAFKLFEASQQQAFNAKDLISGSTDLEDFDAAAKILERRLDLAQQGLQAARSSGNAAAIAKAEQQVVTALNDQINLEKQRTAIIEQRKVQAEAAAAEDSAQTQNLKKLVSEIKKEIDILNGTGGVLNDAQLQASQEKVKGLLDQLKGFGLDSEQVDLTEFLGIQDLAATFQKDIDAAVNGIASRRGEIVGEVEQIYSQLNALVDDNVIEIAIALKLTEGGPDQIGSLVEAFANGAKEIDNLTGAQARYEQAQLRVNANQQLFRDLFAGTTGPKQFIDNLTASVEGLATRTDLTEDQVKSFISALKGVVGTDVFDQIDLGGEAGDQQVLEQILNVWRNLQKARQDFENVETSTEGDRERLQQLQNFQSVADQNVQTIQGLIDLMSNAKDATGQIGQEALNNITSIQQNSDRWKVVEDAIKKAKAAVDDYSKAVREAPPPPSGGGGANSMFGGFRGPLFRAAGGFARGTDTIPAMLSPGEFVVNARASRRFSSQLIAMNAGVQPVYRQEGGPIVNNTVNVGDINVNGTANPDDTARRVVSQLRREFRRGTASRF